MTTPWVPPYFGSYEQLVQSLLHTPYLGGGGASPSHPHTIMAAEQLTLRRPEPALDPWNEPLPCPWTAAVSYLVSALSLKEVASTVKNERLRTSLSENGEIAISQFLEDFCGTPPRRIPWPWPGPPPWIIPLASELTTFANTLQEGHFRGEVLNVAGRILEKGFAAID